MREKRSTLGIFFICRYMSARNVFRNKTSAPEMLLLCFWPLFLVALASSLIFVTIILSISWPSLKVCITLTNPRAHRGTFEWMWIHLWALDSLVHFLCLIISTLSSSSFNSYDLKYMDGSFVHPTFCLPIFAKPSMTS